MSHETHKWHRISGNCIPPEDLHNLRNLCLIPVSGL